MRRIAASAILLTAVLMSSCTRPARNGLAPANFPRALLVDGLQRSYIVHVPASPPPGGHLPLIVVLHGTFGSGRKMQIGLGFDEYADATGFVVAYPDAYDGARWNDGRGTLESSALGVDDVKFIVSMVSDIADEWSIDQDRVFVTGASNGGILAYRLGCETSDVFAAIAPVIGSIAEPIQSQCAPQAPISILSINGDADPYIPFDGGEVCADVTRGCEKGYVISTEESLARFAQANQCSAVPRSETLPSAVDDGTSVERLVYEDCGSGGRVEMYVVHGGGHSWPPREPQLPSQGGASTGNLDATELIVGFFLGNR